MWIFWEEVDSWNMEYLSGFFKICLVWGWHCVKMTIFEFAFIKVTILKCMNSLYLSHRLRQSNYVKPHVPFNQYKEQALKDPLHSRTPICVQFVRTPYNTYSSLCNNNIVIPVSFVVLLLYPPMPLLWEESKIVDSDVLAARYFYR